MSNRKRAKRRRCARRDRADALSPTGRDASGGRARLHTINIVDGKPVSVPAGLGLKGNVPFLGEVMVCILCGKEEASNPHIESNWRALQLGEGARRRRYYACTDHFPPDTASAEAFKAGYIPFFEAAIQAWRGQND